MPSRASSVLTLLQQQQEHIGVVLIAIMMEISATAQPAIKTAQTVKPKPMEQCLTSVPALAMPTILPQTTGLLPQLARLPRLTLSRH